MPKPPPIDMNKVSQDVGQRFDRTVGQYFPAAAATGASLAIPGLASKGPLLGRLAGSVAGGSLGGAGGAGLFEEDPSLQDTLIGAGLGAVGGPAAEAALGPILQRLLPKITGRLPQEQVFAQGDDLIRQTQTQGPIPQTPMDEVSSPISVNDPDAQIAQIREIIRKRDAGELPQPVQREVNIPPIQARPSSVDPGAVPRGGYAGSPQKTARMTPEEFEVEAASIRRMLGDTANARPPIDPRAVTQPSPNAGIPSNENVTNPGGFGDDLQVINEVRPEDSRFLRFMEGDPGHPDGYRPKDTIDILMRGNNTDPNLKGLMRSGDVRVPPPPIRPLELPPLPEHLQGGGPLYLPSSEARARKRSLVGEVHRAGAKASRAKTDRSKGRRQAEQNAIRAIMRLKQLQAEAEQLGISGAGSIDDLTASDLSSAVLRSDELKRILKDADYSLFEPPKP